MNGVLIVDKPAGPTSFEVVQRVRRALGVQKAGHTGTLDPLATGVLPICLGGATRIAGFIALADKTYEAVIRLGVETDTLDAAGAVVAEKPVPTLDEAALEAALSRFRGTFAQTPPMYSAVKVGGKRLYELARAGEQVERAPREVTVHELVLRDFSADEIRVGVKASKGFFVRTLAHDLGAALGCGAHLKALRRTQSGPFTLERAVPLERIEAGEPVRDRLIPVEDALSELPAVRVSSGEAQKVVHGVPLEVPSPPGRVRVIGPGERLLAIAEVSDVGRLKYLRVLATGEA